MGETDNKDRDRDEIFSRTIRAGKRTYFFDVKATVADEYYLTITESKRRFSNEQGKFFYEKHKLFLYKEDFEKFINGLTDVIGFIQTGKIPERIEEIDDESTLTMESSSGNKHADLKFEDLTSEPEED